MTLKEQRFEEFVDDIQARHDELSEIREWRRLKNHEEKAICLYHEVGEDLDTFSMRMRTHDQQEMEYHCQRKKQKDIDLDPIEASRKSNVRAQEYIQQYIGAREAEKRARDQERIRNNAVAEFKAGVQASSDPVTNAKIITNTTGHSKQASNLSSNSRSLRKMATPVIPSPLLEQARQGSKSRRQSPAKKKSAVNSGTKFEHCQQQRIEQQCH